MSIQETDSLEVRGRTKHLLATNWTLIAFYLVAGGAAGIAAAEVVFMATVLAFASLLIVSNRLARNRRFVFASTITILQVIVNVVAVTFLFDFEHYLESYRSAMYMTAALLLSGLIAFQRWQIVMVAVSSLVVLNVAVLGRIVPQVGFADGLVSAYVAQNLGLIFLGYVAYSIRVFTEQLIEEANLNRTEARRKNERIEASVSRSRQGIDLGTTMLELTGKSSSSLAVTRNNIEHVRDVAQRLTEEVREIAAAFGLIDASRKQLTSGIGATAHRSGQTRNQMNVMTEATQRTYQLSEDLDNRLRSRADELVQRRKRLDDVIGQLESVVAANRSMADSASMITDIAEKTHILAMNALIVAGRAGSEGAGFAVVANEVRDLATVSAERAREIQTAIETSGATAHKAEAAAAEIGSFVAQIQTELSDASNGFQEVRASMESIHARAADITGDMDALGAAAQESEEQLNQVERHVANGSELIARFVDELDAVSQAIAQVDDQSKNLEQFAGQIADLGSRNKTQIDELFATLQTD